MLNSNIKSSAFGLAKGRDIKTDDFYAITSTSNLTIAIVCDGVGSAEAGAEAAKRVTNYLLNNFKIRPRAWSIEKSISTFISSINSILYEEGMANFERSELLTTLALVVIEGNRLYGANVGDSRVYLHRNGSLMQLSLDHVEHEGSHILTHVLGGEKSVKPFYFENILSKNDIILLCSDGLYNTLSHGLIEKNVYLGAHLLVKKASHSMYDNLVDDTTAIVLEILQDDERSSLKHQNLPIAKSVHVGQNIDGYKLEKSFNDNTWLASKNTKEYILKFAPKEAIDDENLLDLFVKEAWNAKRLKSSCFPKAVIPKNRSYRYYVMQKIDGQDLHAFLKQKTLTIDDAINLGKILLQMSQFLLRYDLVHGDIKPQNIMIEKKAQEMEFKIIDFGSITEIFSISSKAGTPSFLSPDRFLNEAISESSEMFSLGVTLYLSLTKKYPYGEIEPFQNPIFKEPKAPSFYNENIPHWLDSVILRSIAIDKEKRYAHYSEMAYELQNPQKVAPFFLKNRFFIKSHGLAFYKAGFVIMIVVNAILLVWMNAK